MSALCCMDRTARQRLYYRLARECHFNAHELAARCGVGVRQLTHYFEQDIGRAPQEWLKEQKMIAAGYLLREAGAVKPVSMELGYSRADNFARDFRQAHGLTPREFLRQWRKYSMHFRI